jgi:lipopolysaccharide export system protein LptA
MCTLKLLSSAALLFVLPIGIAAAAQQVAPKPAPSEESRTTITSKKMTVRNQENRAVFEGTVVLTKGSLVVHSDVMVVFFKAIDQAAKPDGQTPKAGQDPKPDLPVMSNRAVSMIEATGKVVKIVKADGQATCRKAVYDEADDKIVLTGDPVAWQNGTRVSGEKITMYLAEDRSVVEGGSHVLIDQETGGR